MDARLRHGIATSYVPTGVLGQVGAILTHAGGNQSVLHTTLRSNTPTTAVVAGAGR